MQALALANGVYIINDYNSTAYVSVEKFGKPKPQMP